MIEFKDEKLVKAVSDSLDLFTGADGGGNFVIFCDFIHKMEAEDSKDSKQILDIIIRFGRLINVVVS